MKYIESLELREWVKDNLKKTIFQKAHALAVQTGCQILVKLQDDSDVTQHQYYATSRLRKVYRQNGLREQTGEKFVSGVTGEPLVDQAIQSVESGRGGLDNTTSHGNIVDKGQESAPENEIRSQGSGPDENLESEDTTGGDDTAIPMQLSLSVSSEPFASEDGTEDSSQTDFKPSQESFDNTGAADDNLPVKIKVERIDDDDEDDPGGGGGGDDDLDARNTSMYQEQMGFDTTASTSQSTMPASTTSQLMDSSQFQGAPPSAPVVQYQPYQVPMSPKPYQCAMCGKTFRSVQVLQKHTQTFHMKTQHVMGVRIRGRGRGRPPSRLTHQLLSHPQPSSYTCVMCNISFPDAAVLQEHMTRSHMGGATPQPQEAPSNPDFSAPGTSQQSPGGSNFPIPHTQSSVPGDAPAASQGSPYSQQGTPPAVPVYPRSISSTAGNRSASSPGTARNPFTMAEVIADEHDTTTTVNESAFAALTEKELAEIEEGRDDTSTKYTTSWGIKRFKSWLKARQLPEDFENLAPKDLAERLRVFYAEVRRFDGEPYSKHALCGLRSSIHRYLTSEPFQRSFNIIRDNEFTKANKMLMGVLKKQKRQGLAETKHHQPIHPADLRLLMQSGVLNTTTPEGLQNLVWFNVQCYFYSGGGQQEFKKDSFEFLIDAEGREYVQLRYNEATKSYPGGVCDIMKSNKMFATGEANCPVNALKMYLGKLNKKCEAFYQRPRTGRISPFEEEWYMDAPVGHNKLKAMMKEISKAANLSQVYTNHCIRAIGSCTMNWGHNVLPAPK